MKTKYDIGETVLVPCKVKTIGISKNGVEYKVIPNGYENTTLALEEHEIHSGMCRNRRVKQNERSI